MWVLLEIWFNSQQRKNSKHSLRFDEVNIMSTMDAILLEGILCDKFELLTSQGKATTCTPQILQSFHQLI